MLSLTGLTWLWGLIASLILSYKILRRYKWHKNPTLLVLGLFFIFLVVSFIFFSGSLFTHDPSLLKLLLFLGHIALSVAFIVLPYVIWYLKFQHHTTIPSWLPSLVISPLFIVFLYLEVQNTYMPDIIEFGSFSVVQWNLSVEAFIVFLVSIWISALPVGIIFFRQGHKFRGRVKVRSYALSFAFIVASIAGVLTTLRHPEVFVVLETILSFVGLGGLMVAALFFSPAKSASLK